MKMTFPLRSLVVCIAVAISRSPAVASPELPELVVQNCLDSGPGSLRQAVIDDTAGEPIDLTQLTCSGITLTTGAIEVTHAQLIHGPGAALFTIDGARLDRVFVQTSTEPLALYGMTIENGYATSFGGGCVYAAGVLQLNDTVVKDCRVSDIGSTTSLRGGGVDVRGMFVAFGSSIIDNQVYSALGSAFGGGASVYGAALLDHSIISGNVVSSASGLSTAVGGIDVSGTLTMLYSTVSDNHVHALPSAPGSIGGLRAWRGATIRQSTVSGNSADGPKGGLYLYYGGSSVGPTLVVESTISGNSAGLGIGGLDAIGPTHIFNSTIAFNVEAASIGAGVRISYGTLDLESTIVAANTSGGAAQNIGTGTQGLVAGANNLIGPSPAVPLPPDTIVGDPMLLPLHDNGGPTKTHALRAGSPAVDAGNNVGGFPTDQRGTGHARVIGAFADIGAFEGVDADSIFYDGFD